MKKYLVLLLILAGSALAQVTIGGTVGGVIGVAPPSVPTLSTPANSATFASGTTDTIITWGAVTGAASYDYAVWTVSCGGTSFASGNTASTSVSISSLTDGTTYYWQVRSVNTYLKSAYSACFSFSISGSAATVYASNTFAAGTISPFDQTDACAWNNASNVNQGACGTPPSDQFPCAIDNTTGVDDTHSLKCPIAIAGNGASVWKNVIKFEFGTGNAYPNNPAFSAPPLWIRYYNKVDQPNLDCMAADTFNQQKLGLTRSTPNAYAWIQPLFGANQYPTNPAALDFVYDPAPPGLGAINGIVTMTAGNWFGWKYELSRSGGTGCISAWYTTDAGATQNQFINNVCNTMLGADTTEKQDVWLGVAANQQQNCSTASAMNLWLDRVSLATADPGW